MYVYLLFKYNKLLRTFQIPSWICCNMEGNDEARCKDDCSSSSVEMDLNESNFQENDETISEGEAYNEYPSLDYLLTFMVYLVGTKH